MKFNITPPKETILSVKDLPVGQLAEIVQWNGKKEINYIGDVVCMIGEEYCKVLVSLSNQQRYWVKVESFPNECKVKILPERTKIELIQE